MKKDRANIFVQMDGKWFTNPTIYDKGGEWYIEFEYKTPLTLVILPDAKVAVELQDRANSNTFLARLVLEKLGIRKPTVLRIYRAFKRFPPEWNDMQFSINVLFSVAEPMSMKAIKNARIMHTGEYADRPSEEGIFYTFSNKERK